MMLAGDCRTVLPTLPAESVHCCGLGIELNPAYADMAVRRVTDDAPLLAWDNTA